MNLREETKKILINDVVKMFSSWAAGAFGFAVLFICFDIDTAAGIGLGILFGFLLSSIPFGWRWVSTFFTALTPAAVIIKGAMSVSLGWIAMPVILIKDIVSYADAVKK